VTTIELDVFPKIARGTVEAPTVTVPAGEVVGIVMVPGGSGGPSSGGGGSSALPEVILPDSPYDQKFWGVPGKEFSAGNGSMTLDFMIEDTAGYVNYTEFVVVTPITITDVRVDYNRAPTVSSDLRLAIYATDDTGQPADLKWDSGVYATEVGSSYGELNGLGVSLAPGTYWSAVKANTNEPLLMRVYRTSSRFFAATSYGMDGVTVFQAVQPFTDAWGEPGPPIVWGSSNGAVPFSLFLMRWTND
jgi:hypothetical protein